MPEVPPCRGTGMDGHLRRYGDIADGLLRSHPVIRRIQRAEIQTDFGVSEERVWCAARGTDRRTAERHHRTVTEFQPVAGAIRHPGHDAADNRYHQA